MQYSGKFNIFLDGFVPIMQSANSNLDRESQVGNYATVVSTRKMIEREQDLENMGLLNIWAEAAPINELTMSPGYDMQYTQYQWAGKFCVTKPMERFDQRQLVATATQQLGDSSWKTYEFVGSSYLNNGSSATSPTIAGLPYINTRGGDNLALFSTAHTWKSNPTATWANRSASPGDPTETQFNIEYKVLARWKDNVGIPLGVQFSGVIVPPELWTTAKVNLESRLTPDTANNAENSAAMTMRAGMNIMQYPWLSSSSVWFLKTNAKQGSLKIFWGWKPEFNKHPPTENAITTFTQDMSLASGALVLRSLYMVG